MNNLFSKRRQRHFMLLLKYWRLVFNDHFVIALFFLFGVGVDTLYVVDVDGGRKEVNDSVEKHLNALVLVGRTAENGGTFHSYGSFSQTDADFVGGKFHGFKELFHEFVVAFCGSFHDCEVSRFRSVAHVFGNFCLVILLAVVGIVDFGVHFDKVNDAFESIFLADGKLDGNGIGVEPFLHHLYGSFKVCAVDVHLVDVCDAGNLVLVSLTPYGFGLRFNAALCTESCYCAVKYAERTFNFYGEVNVSRGIDDVNSAFVSLGFAGSRPMAGSCGGCDGYAALLFLNHPVHGCGTVVGFTYFMIDTGIVKDTLRSRGLARVYVRHNTDVSGMQ